jgi:hypothetical protein
MELGIAAADGRQRVGIMTSGKGWDNDSWEMAGLIKGNREGVDTETYDGDVAYDGVVAVSWVVDCAATYWEAVVETELPGACSVSYNRTEL